MSTPVIVRYDGVQEGLELETFDNLCYTVLSHFVGTDGRCYYQSSWIGVNSLLKIGLDLSNVKIVEGGKR